MSSNTEIYGAVRISLPWHRKVLALPDDVRLAAVGFYCATLALCQALRNDGYLPTGQLAGVIECSKGERDRVVAALIGVRLFDAADGGVQVHDWLQHNRSKAEIEAGRTAMSEGGRKGGKLAGAGRPKVPQRPTPKGSTVQCSEVIALEVGARGLDHDLACPDCHGSGVVASGDPCEWCSTTE